MWPDVGARLRLPPPPTTLDSAAAPMSHDEDLAEFRHHLRELVRLLRMPVRDLERSLGIGHGKLERLLNGELEKWS